MVLSSKLYKLIRALLSKRAENLVCITRRSSSHPSGAERFVSRRFCALAAPIVRAKPSTYKPPLNLALNEDQDMSWVTGSTIFLEIWPIIESKIKSKKELNKFGEELILFFQQHDVDINDLLGSSKSLDKLLESKFKLSEDDEAYVGLENNETTLMQVASNLASSLKVEFNEDEDCVWLSGRIQGGNTTVCLQLYNWANKEYSLVLGRETPVFSDDGSVEIQYKEMRKSLTDNLNVENLTLSALSLLKSIAENESNFDKVVPLKSTTKNEFLESLKKKPILNI